MLLGFNEIQIRNSPRYCRSRVENDVLMDVVVPNLETKPCIRKAKTDASGELPEDIASPCFRQVCTVQIHLFENPPFVHYQ